MAGMNTGNISGAVRIEPVAVTGGPADIVSAMNDSFDEHLQRARHETADRPAAPEKPRGSDTPPDPPEATTDGPKTAETDRQDPVQSESGATASESADTAEADEQSDGEEKTDAEATGAEAAAASELAGPIPEDPSQTPTEPKAATEPSADPSKTPTGLAMEEGPEGNAANPRQADPTQTAPADPSDKPAQVVVEPFEPTRDSQATPAAESSDQPNDPEATKVVATVAAEPEVAASKRPQRSTDPKRSASDSADARPDASKTSDEPVAAVPTGAETTMTAAPAGAADAASRDSETGASAPKPAPLGVNPVDPGVSDRVGSSGEPQSGTTGPGRPGAGLDQVDRVRFVQRVARAFESLGARGGTIRMRLHPPELGSLQLDITVRNGVMTARLETDSAAARNLLLDNLPALRDRLAQQDIKVERFDVDLADGSSGGSPERPDDRPQRDDHPDRRGSPEAGDTGPEGPSAPRVATRPGEGTYVNVVV